MAFHSLLALAFGFSIVFPSQVGASPVGTGNGGCTCPPGFQSGTNVVSMSLPYTVAQVVSIVGNFANISYMGVDPSAVTTTGTPNQPGETRSYTLLGAPITERLITLQMPAGPNAAYFENHSLDQTTVPSLNVTASASTDSTLASPICGGKATAMKLTTVFCSDNVAVANQTFNSIHVGAVTTIGQFLGGATFVGC